MHTVGVNMREPDGFSNFNGDGFGASDGQREIHTQMRGAHDASLHVIAIVICAENASTKDNNALFPPA